jgi:predicted Ser/Thr protein kinase
VRDTVFPTCHLPTELIDDLTEENLTVVEVLFSNPRKGRWTLRVERVQDKSPAVLKWCHPSALQEHRSCFQTEQEVYNLKNEISCMPRLLLSKNNFLLIEYVEGTSLRQFLIEYASGARDGDYAELINVLNKLILQLEKYYIISYQCQDAKVVAKQMTSFWSKLFLSGPMGTRRSLFEDKLMRIVSRTFKKIVKNVFLWKLMRTYPDGLMPTSNCIHGDFHCNNILISKEDRDVYFIDHESVSERKFWMQDLLYLWPMVLKLMPDKECRESAIDLAFSSHLFRESREKTFFNFGILLMRLAIYTNKRFSSNPVKC